MSTKINYRRNHCKIQDNGPRWESLTPNEGGRGVAKGRKKWKRIGARSERRTGERGKSILMNGGKLVSRPKIELDETHILY